MLFQPTNITPSTFGGLGNGTVDVNNGINVSWQVNGNSPMTAFSISIYQNDTASTLLYTTGKTSQGCPFYGTDYNGNIQFFQYAITSEQLAAAGISNGGEYKLLITQWWASNDSVTLSSAAAFITRATPTLSINNLPATINSRQATFRAVYNQPQGDGLMFVRWRVAVVNELGGYDLLKDTGNIYGTSELKTTYDGFFTGSTYAVRCNIQTINGVEADTGWATFAVEYPTSSISGYVNACAARGTMGVYVSWSNMQNIPGTANGLYTADGQLTLRSGITATWDTVNGSSMSISEPWSLIWSGETVGSAAVPVTLGVGNGDVVTLSVTASALTLLKNGTALYTQNLTGATRGKYLVVLEQDSIAVQFRAYANDGLYPSTALYPSNTLYPRDDTLASTPTIYISDFTPIEGRITSVMLSGPTVSDFIYITGEKIPNDDVDQIVGTIDYAPATEWDDNTKLYADFNDGIWGGNIGALSDPFEGFSVYRLEGASTTFKHIADVPITVSQILDYSAHANTEYTYFLFAKGNETYATTSLISNTVVPCWNMWSVIESELKEDGNYHPIAEYKFNKNLTSGAISNNNAPVIYENFTKYPLIQPKSSNYKSGALMALIGIVSAGEYTDTMAKTNAIYALSNSLDYIFLKSRKGDILQVKPSAPIEMTIADSTAEQATTVSLPWVQIGDDDEVTIVSTPEDEFWSSSDVYQTFVTAEGQIFTVRQGDSIGKQYRSIYTGHEIDTALSRIIYTGNASIVIAENMLVASWISDSTYSGFGYRASISIAGVSADMIPDVTFALADAASGNYAPVAATYNGGVYIYSKTNASITVPSIVCTKEVGN